METFVVVGDPC